MHRAARPLVANQQIGFPCQLEKDGQCAGAAAQSPDFSMLSIGYCAEFGIKRSIGDIAPRTDDEILVSIKFQCRCLITCKSQHTLGVRVDAIDGSLIIKALNCQEAFFIDGPLGGRVRGNKIGGICDYQTALLYCAQRHLQLPIYHKYAAALLGKGGELLFRLRDIRITGKGNLYIVVVDDIAFHRCGNRGLCCHHHGRFPIQHHIADKRGDTKLHHVLPQTATNGFRGGIHCLVNDKTASFLHIDITGHEGMVRELECGTGLDGDIRPFQGGVGPVTTVGHVDMGGIDTLQFHRAGFHGEPAGIAVIAGKCPDSALGIVVLHCQLSLTIAGAFVHEATVECAGAGVGERGVLSCCFTHGSEIADAGPLAGTFLSDNTPAQIVPVQIQQTAIVAESESVTRHGIGLELVILHEHDGGHTGFETHGTCGVATGSVQTGLTFIAQGTPDDISFSILFDDILSFATTHTQHGIVVAAAGDGHGAFAHFAPLFGGRGGQLQREFGSFIDDKTSTVERIACLLFCEFPAAVYKGECTCAHVDTALKLQCLCLAGIGGGKIEPLVGVWVVRRPASCVFVSSFTLGQVPFAAAGILIPPQNGFSPGKTDIR